MTKHEIIIHAAFFPTEGTSEVAVDPVQQQNRKQQTTLPKILRFNRFPKKQTIRLHKDLPSSMPFTKNMEGLNFTQLLTDNDSFSFDIKVQEIPCR